LGAKQTSAIEIRQAAVGQASLLADLWLRSRASSVPSIPPAVHTDMEIHEWFREVVLPNQEVWVAVNASSPVGLMVLDDAWIDQLYVDPAFTRQGVGGELVDQAKAIRPNGLKLWTFKSNIGARRFYERHGFIEVAETPGDNEEKAPDVCYQWRPVLRSLPKVQ
jgi:GNAT superfamily N-acetyltransferase